MTYSTEVLADSPLGYWRLDDTSGTTAVDSSGNSRDGSYIGTPLLGEASLLGTGGGTSVALDGANDGIRVAHNSVFNATAAGGLTVEGWVQLDNPAADKLQIFADKTNLSVSSNGQWYLIYDNRSSQGSPQRVRFIMGSGAGTPWVDWSGADVATAMSAGGMFAARKDGNDLALFWDGAQVAETLGHSFTMSASSQALAFGDTSAGNASFRLAGTLDEFAIFGTALSDTRIGEHFQASRPPTALNLAGTLPALTESITLRSYTGTLTDNEAGAVLIRGSSIEPVNAPDVEPVPAGVSRAEMRDKAVAYTLPTMVNGRPT